MLLGLGVAVMKERSGRTGLTSAGPLPSFWSSKPYILFIPLSLMVERLRSSNANVFCDLFKANILPAPIRPLIDQSVGLSWLTVICLRITPSWSRAIGNASNLTHLTHLTDSPDSLLTGHVRKITGNTLRITTCFPGMVYEKQFTHIESAPVHGGLFTHIESFPSCVRRTVPARTPPSMTPGKSSFLSIGTSWLGIEYGIK
uniref:Uncharacterized protein n=1 Tax=Picea sitchensis TaxID=3332 RepID=A0A6B9XT09_PICSI|nr:hypothetical protein Q903MT_gene6664 [Picea sitchensis]